jgi:hypothetical protein
VAVTSVEKTDPKLFTSINTKRPGKFLITLTVSDGAGVYGRNQQNNVATARKAVLVKDTMDPWINVVGADPVYHQCTRYSATPLLPRLGHLQHNATAGECYTDKKALTTDNLDSTNNPTMVNSELDANAATVNVALSDDYTLFYDHTDCAGNAAAQQSRVVKVRDTVGPTVTIIGLETVQYRHWNNNTGLNTHADDGAHGADIEESAMAMDLCDNTIDPINGVKCSAIHPSVAGVKDNNNEFNPNSKHSSPGTAECKMTWSRDGFRLSGFANDRPNSDGSIEVDAPLGTYIRTYTVQDNVGNRGHAKRTFEVIDDEDPTITCMKAADATDCHETYQATRDEEYTDKGATCNDYVDGELSHAVEVSGQVVNMRVPGTYIIHYDCQDLSGNEAPRVSRHVTIVDTTCPTITLTDAAFVYVEAGFPYVDTGATATDDLDGDITALITVDGDTVNTASAFYSRRSCKDIWDSYHADVHGETGTRVTGKHNEDDLPNGKDTLSCGNYWITTQDTNHAFERTEVWCDMAGNKGTYYFTQTDEAVYPADSDKVIAKCTAKGMVAFTERTGEKFTNVFEHVNSTVFHDADPNYYGLDAVVASQTETSATCTFESDLKYANTTWSQDGTTERRSSYTTHQDHDQISGFVQPATNEADDVKHFNNKAETGKYLLQFHVVDNAGNKECQTKVRTVVVRDTLRPVISLHLGKDDQNMKLIHTSAAADRGLDGEENPAGMDRDSVTAPNGMEESTYGNPHLHDNGHILMAEESQASSTNGWIVGAAASAVTGLALLGYSQRKSTVTTVPV